MTTTNTTINNSEQQLFIDAKETLDRIYREVDSLFADKKRVFTVEELMEIFDSWVKSVVTVKTKLETRVFISDSYALAIDQVLYGIKEMRKRILGRGITHGRL